MTNIFWVKDIHELSVAPSPKISDWLLKPTILTQTLKQVCHHLKVVVVSQGFAICHLEEKNLLITPTETAWVRQVVLCGDEIPFTFGRVIAPMPTYRQYENELKGLNNKPIGETLLYHREGVSRGSFEYAYLPQTHPQTTEIFHFISEHCAPLWGRRSLFMLQDFPLLVSEFIFPTIPDYPHDFISAD